MTVCEELEDLIPAYVLDAIEEADRTRIENHLPHCAHCTQLVAAYRPVAGLLPFAVKQVDPPADLRYRVMAAALPRRKPQEAPRPSFLASLSAGLATFLRSPAMAALLLLFVVGLATWNVSLQNQVIQQSTYDRQMLADLSRQKDFLSVMAYTDTQPMHLQGTEVASRAVGRLYGTADDTTMALIAYELPVLPSNQVYQVWLVDANGDRTSGGMFTVDQEGRGWLLVRAPKPLSSYQGIGVTAEPAGGSLKPTGAKMMSAQFIHTN